MTTMTRQGVLERLKELIPSFHREFIDKEFYGETGWLYIDHYGLNLPEVIPEHYLEGIKLKRNDGKEGVTMRYETFPTLLEWKRQKGKFTDRKVVFSYMNYPGNPHRYGTLEIDGVEFITKTDTGYSSGGIFFKDFVKEYPEIVNAHSIWEVELARIVTQEDISDKSVDWDMYEVGSRTTRFTSMRELRQTALYVALLRVQGPFYMEDDHVIGNDKKKLIIHVNENDEVTFFNGMENILF